jgi:hypothetical protein
MDNVDPVLAGRADRTARRVATAEEALEFLKAAIMAEIIGGVELKFWSSGRTDIDVGLKLAEMLNLPNFPARPYELGDKYRLYFVTAAPKWGIRLVENGTWKRRVIEDVIPFDRRPVAGGPVKANRDKRKQERKRRRGQVSTTA